MISGYSTSPACPRHLRFGADRPWRRGGDQRVRPVQTGHPAQVGQFSFTEQDLVIPVNGIPLTVTRTYSSLNPRSADFGYSWTYTLIGMDVELDDERQDVIIGRP